MSQIILDLNPETANKLNNYIKLFGSDDLLFEKFIEFYRKKLKLNTAIITKLPITN